MTSYFLRCFAILCATIFLYVEQLSAQEGTLPECSSVSAVSEARRFPEGTWAYIHNVPTILQTPDKFPPSYGQLFGSIDGQFTLVAFEFGHASLSSNANFLVTTEQNALQEVRLASIYIGIVDFATVLRVFDGLPSRNGATIEVEIKINGESFLYSEFAKPHDFPENLNFPKISGFFSDQQWHVVLHPSAEYGKLIASHLLDGGSPEDVEFFVSVEGNDEEFIQYKLNSFVTGDALRELISGEPHPLSLSEKFLTEFFRVREMHRNGECQQPTFNGNLFGGSD